MNIRLMIITMVLTATSLGSAAQPRQTVQLSDLYEELDKAISHSADYVAEQEHEIATLKLNYTTEPHLETRFIQALQLYDLYHAYVNDSALAYIRQAIRLAEECQRPDLVGQAQSLLAYQCSAVGMYVEAKDLLARIDPSALSREGLAAYYKAQMHVAGEVGYYSSIDTERDHYYGLQHVYKDSLMSVIDERSADYYQQRLMELVGSDRLEEALAVSDRWLNMTNEGTHENAIAAYYRHIIYDHMGDGELTRYWLAKSALDDIRCAVMDQASLMTLANLLQIDGDGERSYRYIQFTWDCNTRFNTRMRSWQLTPVLTTIEHSYQQSQDRSQLILEVAIGVFMLMTVVLLGVVRYARQQKRRLMQALAEQERETDEQRRLNEKLKVDNILMSHDIKHLKIVAAL